VSAMSPRTSSNRFFVIGMALLVLHAFGTNPLEGQTTSVPFLVNNGGADTETTLGGPASVSVGFARVQAGQGRSTPSGVAIFGLRQNGILVSEAGVPASPLISSGRIYAEVNGSVTTGLAIANPSAQSAVITYYFSDQNRTSFGTDTLIIPAGSQIAGFLDLDPFNGDGPINGTFTFTSTVPIAAVALRGLTNERGEFLMTTLPVSPLTPPNGDISYFPHFADGAGWTTTFVLLNPTDMPMTGTVQFFGHGSGNTPAVPISVTINGQTDSEFNYSIAPRSSEKLQTEGAGPTPESGSVRVMPSLNGQTPSGLAIFSLRVDGVTVTEAGVASSEAGRAFRLYAQATDASEGSIQTGIAIVNRASTRVDVTVELQTLGGGSTGLTGGHYKRCVKVIRRQPSI
jgi:hypothetical protein